jgi:sugar phosphate isomerase/epimerase
MKPSIGLQLYSVREQLSKDFEGTIRKIAEFGYAVAEPAGFPGSTPQKAAALFKELGLKSLSCHGQLPVGDKVAEVTDMMKAIGAKYLISGKGPDDFKTMDKIKAVADLFNEAAANASKNGFKIGYHNHDWELPDVDGKPGLLHLKDLLSKDIVFEVDTFWVTTGGKKALDILKELKGRTPVIHIKDGTCSRNPLKFMAAGTGKMDFPPILKATQDIEAYIVELDSCETDMLEAVKASFDYLAKSGFAEVKKKK